MCFLYYAINFLLFLLTIFNILSSAAFFKLANTSSLFKSNSFTHTCMIFSSYWPSFFYFIFDIASKAFFRFSVSTARPSAIMNKIWCCEIFAAVETGNNLKIQIQEKDVRKKNKKNFIILSDKIILNLGVCKKRSNGIRY